MAAIPHTFTERNTVQTNNSSSYTAVTGIAQASGNFIAGKKYLIVATAQLGASSSVFTDIHVLHGSTEFEGSLGTKAIPSLALKSPWSFVTVWEAIASEDLTIEFRGNPTSGWDNNTVNFVSLLSIQLTDYLTEGVDWHFNERLTDDALTAAFSPGGSITFTPPVASQDWLILTQATFTISSTNAGPLSRLNKDADSTIVPQVSFTSPNTAGPAQHTIARVLSLAASSTTLREEMQAVNSNGTRTYSCIFAMNLNKFSTRGSAYTEADLALNTSAFGDAIQTVNITPLVTGNVWIFGSFGFDKNAAARMVTFRVQVDNSDQPSGQTAIAYTMPPGHAGNSPADEVGMVLSTMLSLSNALHTIDVDGHVDSTTGAPAAQDRTIMAVSMELSALGSGIDSLRVAGSDVVRPVTVSLSTQESG